MYYKQTADSKNESRGVVFLPTETYPQFYEMVLLDDTRRHNIRVNRYELLMRQRGPKGKRSQPELGKKMNILSVKKRMEKCPENLQPPEAFERVIEKNYFTGVYSILHSKPYWFSHFNNNQRKNHHYVEIHIVGYNNVNRMLKVLHMLNQ